MRFTAFAIAALCATSASANRMFSLFHHEPHQDTVDDMLNRQIQSFENFLHRRDFTTGLIDLAFRPIVAPDIRAVEDVSDKDKLKILITGMSPTNLSVLSRGDELEIKGLSADKTFDVVHTRSLPRPVKDAPALTAQFRDGNVLEIHVPYKALKELPDTSRVPIPVLGLAQAQAQLEGGSGANALKESAEEQASAGSQTPGSSASPSS